MSDTPTPGAAVDPAAGQSTPPTPPTPATPATPPSNQKSPPATPPSTPAAPPQTPATSPIVTPPVQPPVTPPVPPAPKPDDAIVPPVDVAKPTEAASSSPPPPPPAAPEVVQEPPATAETPPAAIAQPTVIPDASSPFAKPFSGPSTSEPFEIAPVSLFQQTTTPVIPVQTGVDTQTLMVNKTTELLANYTALMSQNVITQPGLQQGITLLKRVILDMLSPVGAFPANYDVFFNFVDTNKTTLMDPRNALRGSGFLDVVTRSKVETVYTLFWKAVTKNPTAVGLQNAGKLLKGANFLVNYISAKLPNAR